MTQRKITMPEHIFAHESEAVTYIKAALAKNNLPKSYWLTYFNEYLDFHVLQSWRVIVKRTIAANVMAWFV